MDHGADLDAEGTHLQATAPKQISDRAHHRIHFALFQFPQNPLPALFQASARHGAEHHLIGTIVGVVAQQGFNHGHLRYTQQLLFSDGLTAQQRQDTLFPIQDQDTSDLRNR